MTTAFCLKKKKGKNSFGGTGDKRKCIETNSRNPFTEVNDFDDDQVTRKICPNDIFFFPLQLRYVTTPVDCYIPVYGHITQLDERMRNFYPFFFIFSRFLFFFCVNDIVKRRRTNERTKEISRQNKSGQRLKVFQKRQERPT